jgi:hypothetical protein
MDETCSNRDWTEIHPKESACMTHPRRLDDEFNRDLSQEAIGAGGPAMLPWLGRR